MIDFICEMLGYEMRYTTTSNYDQYVIFAGCMMIFVLFILVVYLLVRFLQWIWRAVK